MERVLQSLSVVALPVLLILAGAVNMFVSTAQSTTCLELTSARHGLRVQISSRRFNAQPSIVLVPIQAIHTAISRAVKAFLGSAVLVLILSKI